MMQTRSHCHEGHCGCHAHEKAATRRLFLSFLLLIAGWLLDHAGEIEWFVPSVRMIWYAVAFLPVGLPVMREAFEAARQRDWFNEFSLMTIAAIGAFCIGEYPEAVSVMLFYTLGELLQHKAVDRATRNIGQLLDVRPERTEVWRDGVWTTVSPREVKPGEQIEIKPGGRVPLDGTLQEKEAVFDTSALTGESMPRTLRKGDEVPTTSDRVSVRGSTGDEFHLRQTEAVVAEYGMPRMSGGASMGGCRGDDHGVRPFFCNSPIDDVWQTYSVSKQQSAYYV